MSYLLVYLLLNKKKKKKKKKKSRHHFQVHRPRAVVPIRVWSMDQIYILYSHKVIVGD